MADMEVDKMADMVANMDVDIMADMVVNMVPNMQHNTIPCNTM